MKTLIIFICLLIYISATDAQTVDTTQRFATGTQEDLFLRETEGYLRSSFRFSTTFNIMVIGGAGMMGLDMLDGEMNALSVVGFEIGFAGAEMSKYGPVPLVKARRSFERLAPVWHDTTSYQAVLQSIRLAQSLSIASVVCNFLGQGLILAGFFQQDDKTFSALVAAGAVVGVVALGTSIGATVATQKARIELGKAKGSLAFGAGSSGIGVAYRLP